MPCGAPLQVTDAQLQVSAVPGSRFKFRPSQLAGAGAGGAPTPSLAAGSYRAASPAGGLGASKLTASVGRHTQAAHSTVSFGAYSPQTVTPKQDYVLPPQATSTSRRL
jgi:hypothetical protein